MQIDREKLARALWMATTGESRADKYEILMPIYHRFYHRHITAILADIEAQGFVIVPREPTEAMIIACINECGPIGGTCLSETDARDNWSTMIDAAKGGEG